MDRNNIVIISLAVIVHLLAYVSAQTKEQCLQRCLAGFNAQEGTYTLKDRHSFYYQCTATCENRPSSFGTSTGTGMYYPGTGGNTAITNRGQCLNRCQAQFRAEEAVYSLPVREYILDQCQIPCLKLPSWTAGTRQVNNGNTGTSTAQAQCDNRCTIQYNSLLGRVTEQHRNSILIECRSSCATLTPSTGNTGTGNGMGTSPAPTGTESSETTKWKQCKANCDSQRRSMINGIGGVRRDFINTVFKRCEDSCLEILPTVTRKCSGWAEKLKKMYATESADFQRELEKRALQACTDSR